VCSIAKCLECGILAVKSEDVQECDTQMDVISNFEQEYSANRLALTIAANSQIEGTIIQVPQDMLPQKTTFNDKKSLPVKIGASF